MFKIVVGYNTKEEEHLIASKASQNSFEPIHAVLSHDELKTLQNEVANIHMDKELESYILDIIFATREPQNYGLEALKEQIQFGASPRATIDMFKAVKAKAYIRGNDFVTPVDIALVIKDVLRHRIILSYEAEAMNITSDEIIDTILKTIPVP